MNRSAIAGVAGFVLMARCAFGLVTPCAAAPHLELRKIKNESISDESRPVPAEAVQVFTFEGTPRTVHVTRHGIAVAYERSGVLFDRTTRKVMRRLTVADGWPEKRPSYFADPNSNRHRLVGPGVAYDLFRPETGDDKPLIVASAEFDGKTWRALQPGQFLQHIGRGMDWKEMRRQLGAWTPILKRLDQVSYVEATAKANHGRKRYTTADGLASNIVTHLAVAEGALWAACVDIYDPGKQAWGPGGLCRFDPKASRWERVDRIDGRSVRWVTLFQMSQGELWIGFRDGEGVAGDHVSYGMGLFPDHYRPKTTGIVLARLKDGRWTRFARPPRADRPRQNEAPAPTETPRLLARAGNEVILFSTVRSNWPSGNWDVPLSGVVSLLEPRTQRWRQFDTEKDFDADELNLLVAEEGEVLVASNRCLHRWDPAGEVWQLLDTHAVLHNPWLGALTPVGQELWIGYTNQSFGVTGEQGINRFNEQTGRWSYMAPAELGTRCPVRQIVTLPAGEVWVLFQPRIWLGSFGEYPIYPRESRPGRKPPLAPGLGRYAGGKWEFPVKLEGIAGPPLAEGERPVPVGPADISASIEDLTTVGERLFIATKSGVYMGPRSWKRILSGPVVLLEKSADGKALLITREQPEPAQPDESGREAQQRLRFDPASGEIKPEKAAAARAESWDQNWVRLPGLGKGTWTIGDLGTPELGTGSWTIGELNNATHTLVKTPEAFWIDSWGELIRIDRKMLVTAIGK
jgi:hypothetical protein